MNTDTDGKGFQRKGYAEGEQAKKLQENGRYVPETSDLTRVGFSDGPRML